MFDVTKNFGSNLTQILNEKNVSRHDLAVAIGLRDTDISDIENGNIDFDTKLIFTISEKLGVDIETLLKSDNKTQLVDKIISKLKSCSERDLILISDYIDVLSKK
jgi:transcriptional regulator with XRE-family HTH domain